MGPRVGDRPYVCPEPGVGAEGNHTNLALQMVRRGRNESRAILNEKKMAGEHIPQILCMVYAYTGAHDNVQAIADTWARECDGFIAFSNATDHRIGAIDLLHRGPEIYGNMWQKVRSMWAYVYDYYLDAFDYFHICGDDTYVVLDKHASLLDGARSEAPQEWPFGRMVEKFNSCHQMVAPEGSPLVAARNGDRHRIRGICLGCAGLHVESSRRSVVGGGGLAPLHGERDNLRRRRVGDSILCDARSVRV